MNFRSTTIPFSKTGQFSALFLDYVKDAPQLREFYAYRPDRDGYAQALAALETFSFDRETLADALLEQEQDFLVSVPGLKGRIEALRSKDTFTVCTGHQLCLFTGPMYFIYKIISAINLAEALKQQFPGKDFVPVYWMASEDHDFEEIRSAKLFGKTLTWEREPGGAVGRMALEGIAPVLEELKILLGESGREIFGLMQDAYAGAGNLAHATRRLVHALFAKYGLVVLDGDDAKLKKLFLPLMREELMQQPHELLVRAQTGRLQQSGYESQVHPRAINLFRLSPGRRDRLEKEGDQIAVLGTGARFTTEEILQELERDPSSFSPNVVMRPMYQQTLLPNIAYVGGPGELAYWLQYKAMFEAGRCFFPVLAPRSFALIIDSGSQERLRKLGISTGDIFTETEQLVKSYVLRNSSGAISLSEEKEKLKALFSVVAAKAVAVDATLQKAAEAEMQKQLNALEAFEARLLKAEKQKHETATGQIRKLKDKFFPGGTLQERHDNFMPYAVAPGAEKWIAAMKDALKSGADGLQLLEVSA